MDPRATRRVLAGSYAFVDTPYDAVAGPRAHKKVAGMVRKASYFFYLSGNWTDGVVCLQDLRLAVAAVAVDTCEDEGETSGAESETEARIKLIAARTNFVRVDANRRAKLSPRKPHVSSLWADEVDPRATRRVLAGSYAFVDTPYDAVAGPRAHKKVAGMVRKASYFF